MTERRASKLGIFSWMLFDWAAQPYHTLIITFIFAPYFAAYVAPDAAKGQELWGLATGLAGIVIALLAPVLGAMTDASGPRKPWLALFALVAMVGAAGLYLSVPGTDAPVMQVLVFYGLALIGIEFAAVFNNSMMPGLVPRAELGKLSGSGWALGYVGGVVSLILMLGLMVGSPETGKTLLGLTPILGLDPALHEGDRASGPFSAIWLLIFILPLFLFTPDLPKRAGGAPVGVALGNLWQTLKGLPQRGSYLRFLIVSMFYRDGLNALYAFGGIYAAGVLNLSIIQIGVFGIIAAVTGAVGAFIGGRLDEARGPKFVVFWACWLLVLASAAVVSTTPDVALFVIPATGTSLPTIVFYVAGAIIGAAGGSLQASDRNLLVHQVEDEEVASAFGLYALTGRATAFIGPLSVGLVTAISQSQRIGIMPIVVLLALGALGLVLVREREVGKPA